MKDCRAGATSWYKCLANESRIPEMPVFVPLKATSSHSNCNDTVWTGRPILVKLLYWWKSDKVRIIESNF
jgi:hypothetical protein